MSLYAGIPVEHDSFLHAASKFMGKIGYPIPLVIWKYSTSNLPESWNGSSHVKAHINQNKQYSSTVIRAGSCHWLEDVRVVSGYLTWIFCQRRVLYLQCNLPVLLVEGFESLEKRLLSAFPPYFFEKTRNSLSSMFKIGHFHIRRLKHLVDPTVIFIIRDTASAIVDLHHQKEHGGNPWNYKYHSLTISTWVF